MLYINVNNDYTSLGNPPVSYPTAETGQLNSVTDTQHTTLQLRSLIVRTADKYHNGNHSVSLGGPPLSVSSSQCSRMVTHSFPPTSNSTRTDSILSSGSDSDGQARGGRRALAQVGSQGQALPQLPSSSGLSAPAGKLDIPEPPPYHATAPLLTKDPRSTTQRRN